MRIEFHPSGNQWVKIRCESIRHTHGLEHGAFAKRSGGNTDGIHRKLRGGEILRWVASEIYICQRGKSSGRTDSAQKRPNYPLWAIGRRGRESAFRRLRPREITHFGSYPAKDSRAIQLPQRPGGYFTASVGQSSSS